MRRRYGASFLLNQEGNHTFPGHPTLWAEATGSDGDTTMTRYFIGYDYREWSCALNYDETACRDGSAMADTDYMAIRELAWDSSGWPTIWTVIEVSSILQRPVPPSRFRGIGVDARDECEIGVQVDSGIAGFDDVRIFVSALSHKD